MKTLFSRSNLKYLLGFLLFCFSLQATAEIKIVGCFKDYNDKYLDVPPGTIDIYINYTKFPGCIEIINISFGAEQTLDIGSQSLGAGAGKIQFNDLAITKRVDNVSPLFFVNMASGKPFKNVSFFFFKSDPINPNDYTAIMTLQLGLVAFHTMSTNFSTGDDILSETINLEYGQIQMSVYPFNNQGERQAAVVHGWDRVHNTDASTTSADLPKLDPK